ncbi:MAG TPA: phosphohydrolase [Peptococcaceae bacterium]|nr:MAG: Metal dependent phosphohydrolase [Clostridia bacterium 41_269]HBT20333.1 phosphohydrolase [Peptococcaceae bacterium]
MKKEYEELNTTKVNITPEQWNRYEEALRKRVRSGRFEHSKSVAEEAAVLAKKYGANVDAAMLAGLLHDYARDLPDSELLSIAEENNLVSCWVEEKIPLLLHGPVGAVLIKEELGINDEEVLEAVSRHTTGAPDMGKIAKIVYLADSIEPLRKYKGVENFRRLSRINLNIAVFEVMNSSIQYCISKNSLIHPFTLEARNKLLYELESINLDFKELFGRDVIG